jgi:antitoxin component YwqK of YwqJK toxin-antitoxin module
VTNFYQLLSSGRNARSFHQTNKSKKIMYFWHEKKYKMKKILIITGFILLVFSSSKAQDIQEVDGLFYTNGELYSGTYKTHYDNGQVKMEMKVKNGKKHGKVKIYFENGGLNEIRSYKNNLMHGKWEMYNDNHILVSVARYKNGKKHGKWIIWNDEGMLLYELQYTNGQKTGTWKSYDGAGNLVNERKY